MTAYFVICFEDGFNTPTVTPFKTQRLTVTDKNLTSVNSTTRV